MGKILEFFGIGKDKPGRTVQTAADAVSGVGKDGVKGKDKAANKRKKTIEIAAAAILILIILIIYFTTFASPEKDSGTSETGLVSAADYCEKTQSELVTFLSKIKGAGNVTVLINFESTTELVIAYITNINTNTNVAEGGKYVETSQSTSNPVILSQAGSQVPLIIKEIYPKVKGVIVGAEGADDVKVKLSLIDAVRTYFKIGANDVQVFTTEKGKK